MRFAEASCPARYATAHRCRDGRSVRPTAAVPLSTESVNAPMLSSSTTPAATVAVSTEVGSLARVYVELTKARLSALVVLTTAVGFILAMPVGVDWLKLVLTIVGTALSAGSAAALNQFCEIARDASMHRTADRPLPAGRISPRHGLIAGLLMGVAGVGVLASFVNQPTALLSLLTIVIYIGLYTPLKVRSTFNTLVGAVCGAIPPMIGWVAVTGTPDPGAWVLGAILFIWQLPHFLALAWMYREDYARGGFMMLPQVDPNGRITAQVIVVTSLLLLPLGIVSTMIGIAGWLLAAGSIVLALWMVMLGVRFLQYRTDANARKVFLASIVYLPLLLILFVIDRGPLNTGRYDVLSGHQAIAASTTDLPNRADDVTRR